MSNQPPPPPPPPPAGDASWPQADGGQAGADIGVRLGARVIDAIIVAIVGGIVTFLILAPVIFSGIDTGEPGLDVADTLMGGGASGASILASLVSLAITFGYFVGFDVSMGATPGKKLLGMSILGADGGKPTPAESFKRNAWLALSIIPVVGGLLQLGAAIYILVTISQDPRNVGWHDRFAQTLVVRS